MTKKINYYKLYNEINTKYINQKNDSNINNPLLYQK